MQLVNSTMVKKLGLGIITILLSNVILAQGNSPFSRYGIGDLSNNTNVVFRGMGGANIASTSDRFLNPNNPASYSYLGTGMSRFKDMGQIISFDVGTEFNNTTLRQTSPLQKYTSQNLTFNYMQFGTQLSAKGNWGAMFGLQPVSRSNYKIQIDKRLTAIDSLQTVYEGTGGLFKGFIGSGFRMGDFSFGFNTGYLFGKKNTATNLRLVNDSVQYYESNSNTKLNYGNVFLSAGFLYNKDIKDKEGTYKTNYSLGASFETKNTVKSSTDIERLAYDGDNSNNPASITDTISYQRNVGGTMILPQTLNLGFRIARINTDLSQNNMIAFAADYTQTKWSQFRQNGFADQLQDMWQMKGGLEFRPVMNQRNYWSSATYRLGGQYGKDYIKAGGSLNTYAFTLGASLPLAKEIYDFEEERPYINIALEFGKRGTGAVNIKESFARVAFSVSLTDLWYIKRKYD